MIEIDFIKVNEEYQENTRQKKVKDYKWNPEKDIIGKGAFGTVYKAFNLSDESVVAVKEISRYHEQFHSQFKQQILSEVKVLKQIDSEHVIKIYDYFQSDNFYYIVMEYVDHSMTLDTFLIKNNKLYEADAMKIFFQLAQGIRVLQRNGISHRDLKPENILYVPKTRTIKLIDMGLAKQMDLSQFSNNNAQQSKVGTQLYMSPQQIFNLNDVKANKIDMWSLGVILYQLVYKNIHPWMADQESELKKILNSYKNDPNFLNIPIKPVTQENTKDIIRKLLAYDQDQRLDIDQLFVYSPFKEWDSGQEDCKEYPCSKTQQIEDSYYVGVIQDLKDTGIEIKPWVLTMDNYSQEFLKKKKQFQRLSMIEQQQDENQEQILKRQKISESKELIHYDHVWEIYKKIFQFIMKNMEALNQLQLQTVQSKNPFIKEMITLVQFYITKTLALFIENLENLKKIDDQTKNLDIFFFQNFITLDDLQTNLKNHSQIFKTTLSTFNKEYNKIKEMIIKFISKIKEDFKKYENAKLGSNELEMFENIQRHIQNPDFKDHHSIFPMALKIIPKIIYILNENQNNYGTPIYQPVLHVLILSYYFIEVSHKKEKIDYNNLDILQKLAKQIKKFKILLNDLDISNLIDLQKKYIK